MSVKTKIGELNDDDLDDDHEPNRLTNHLYSSEYSERQKKLVDSIKQQKTKKH